MTLRKSKLPSIVLFGLTFLLLYGSSLVPGINSTNQNKDSLPGEAYEIISDLKSGTYDYDKTIKLCSLLMSSGNYREMIRVVKPVYEYAAKEGLNKELTFLTVCMGQAYTALNIPDSMRYYFDRGLILAEETDNLWAFTAIYNGLGVHAISNERNFDKVIPFFLKGLEYAAKSEFPDELSNPILLNIVEAYYIKGDPAGLKYSLEVYNKGKSSGDRYMVTSGALNSAYMYYLSGEYEKALVYIREAAEMAESYNDPGGIFTVYGNILYVMGDSVNAEMYFKKGIQYEDRSDLPSKVNAYLSYGNFLLSELRYGEAVPVFNAGIRKADDENINSRRYELYQGISDAYEHLGDMGNALSYYKIYRREADSVFNIEREHSFNELMIKYESEKQAKEIQQREMELFRETKKLQITILLLIIIVGVAAVIFILYRRKNKMYREIVKQHHDYVQKIKNLDARYLRIDELSTSTGAVRESSEGDRDSELLGRIEKSMKEDKVYRDKNISVDKLAEILNSNRSYVSRIINERFGVSFNHYINSFRIDDALIVLSDIGDDTALKVLSDELGFNSLSTFYRSFQKSVGVPPSKYRQEYKKLYKDS